MWLQGSQVRHESFVIAIRPVGCGFARVKDGDRFRLPLEVDFGVDGRRAVVVHTVTYFIAGLLALTLLNYKALWAEPGLNGFMRPFDDPIVMAGLLFQPFQGLLCGAVFYLLRKQYFSTQYGWLTMWVVIAVLGIFSTFGPAPGSIEGLIFTTLPLRIQLWGFHSEVLAQSLGLSGILFYWVRHTKKRWLTWALTGVFFMVLVLPTLGLLSGLENTVA